MKDPDLMSERELRAAVKEFQNNFKQEIKEMEVEFIDPSWRRHFRNNLNAAYEAYREEIEN